MIKGSYLLKAICNHIISNNSRYCRIRFEKLEIILQTWKKKGRNMVALELMQTVKLCISLSWMIFDKFIILHYHLMEWLYHKYLSQLLTIEPFGVILQWSQVWCWTHYTIYGWISCHKVHDGSAVEVTVRRHKGSIVILWIIRTLAHPYHPFLDLGQVFALKKKSN